MTRSDHPHARRTGAGVSVEAHGWGWRHAGRAAWALSGVDFRIEPGEKVLLLGTSGAGKSTLMHAMAGVLGGNEEGEERGQLRLDGVDPRARRGVAGLVLQDPDSQVILARVGDDVAFGCENLGVERSEIWTRVNDALELVGLDLPLSHPTSRLSGGQKQRLALAGVLAMQPGLVLLDEPTANLDPTGVREVRDSVAQIVHRTNATLIVIEHRVSVWQDLVDRVIVLDAGAGVVADGTPNDVLGAEGERLSASGVWVPGIRHPHIARRPLAERAGGAGQEPLLSTEALSIARTRGTVVQSGLDLAVNAGEVQLITGENGVGKSTLALTLAGLLKPAAGRVLASPSFAAGAGIEPITWSSAALLPRIGTVFQDPEHQFVASSVRAELVVGPSRMKLAPAIRDARVGELLERLRLSHLAEANPFTLSGGEKRRLSVATVLASQPRLLVLDEPTFGQDFRTWQEIVALLAELADEGTGIIAVSHDADLIEALADRVFTLASAQPDAGKGTSASTGSGVGGSFAARAMGPLT